MSDHYGYILHGNMNSKKLECFDDDDSVDGKSSLSFLGKFLRSLRRVWTNLDRKVIIGR